MDTLGGVFGLLGLVLVPVGVVLALVWRSRRRYGGYAFVAGIVLLSSAIILIGIHEDGVKSQGWASSKEQKEARSAGYDDAGAYHAWIRAEAERKIAEQAAAEAAAKAKAEAEAQAAQIKAEEEAARCRRDLGCWAEKHYATAAYDCKKSLESMAKNDVRWTDGFLEPKFPKYKWISIDKGIVGYIGDKVQFQNGFGAWVNYAYMCHYDTERKMVVDVTAKPGRIQ